MYRLDVLRTRRGQQICCFHLEHPESTADTITLVVSHGNALDMGFFVPFGRHLSAELGVNVCGYDYAGYGCSSGVGVRARTRVQRRDGALGCAPQVPYTLGVHPGSPKNCLDAPPALPTSVPSLAHGSLRQTDEANAPWTSVRPHSAAPNIDDTYADIEAVVDHLVRDRGKNPKRLVLYGQSIGSGPSCYYAARAASVRRRKELGDGAGNEGVRVHDVGGLVLVSPIESGLRVISPPHGICNPAFVYSLCDVYPNYRLVPSVRCPTLVIHGDRDAEVPFGHGMNLHGKLSEGVRQDPYWAKGAGHDNVFEVNPFEFLTRMRGFLRVVRGEGAGGGEVGEGRCHAPAGRGRPQRQRESGAPVRASEGQPPGEGPAAQTMVRE